MFLLLSGFLDRHKLPLIIRVFDIHVERRLLGVLVYV